MVAVAPQRFFIVVPDGGFVFDDGDVPLHFPGPVLPVIFRSCLLAGLPQEDLTLRAS
jgi:hypothetical protein